MRKVWKWAPCQIFCIGLILNFWWPSFITCIATQLTTFVTPHLQLIVSHFLPLYSVPSCTLMTPKQYFLVWFCWQALKMCLQLPSRLFSLDIFHTFQNLCPSNGPFFWLLSKFSFLLRLMVSQSIRLSTEKLGVLMLNPLLAISFRSQLDDTALCLP